MGKVRVLSVLLLSGLLLGALLLGLGARAASDVTAMAPQTPAPAVQETPLTSTAAYTTYVPLVARYMDSSYHYPFGVITYGSIQSGTELDLLRNAGAYWLTTSLYWSAIEKTPGVYDWSSFDAKALTAKTAGAELFVLFTSNPTWAAILPGGPVTDTATLVNFVTRMAERYDGDGIADAPGSPIVNYWSFYAEPDNGDLGRALAGKGYFGNTPGLYASMLKSVAPAIHTANPQAKVLIGGLAYDWFEEDGGIFVRSFLTDTLSALNDYPGGAAAYIDEVAFHYYPISTLSWPTIREKAIEVRGILANHQIGDLPLISPEMGYWSSPKWGSSLDSQAYWLVQMYSRALSQGMTQLSWYLPKDSAIPESEDDTYPDRTCGLLDIDANPKPAYYAYATMTGQLKGAHYLRSLSQTNVVGEVFRLPDGRENAVVWATALDPALGYTTVSFPYTCLRRVEIYGTVYAPILDGQDGFDYDTISGRISLGLHETNRPIYVAPCP